MNRSGLKHFASYHLPAILYSALIIGLSSISNLRAPRIRLIELDKVAHFIEYGIFAILVFRSFAHLSWRFRGRVVFLLSLLFMAFFASADETVQRFIPGRRPDLIDFVCDVCGSAVILALLWWRHNRKSSRSGHADN